MEGNSIASTHQIWVLVSFDNIKVTCVSRILTESGIRGPGRTTSPTGYFRFLSAFAHKTLRKRHKETKSPRRIT